MMAKQNSDSSVWTQRYCTGHIGFCLPNWYYKSFGATTTHLWHVEIGMQTIEGLGDGVIMLNLVNGTAALAGASDGSVQTRGADVIAYKNWNGDHFEIAGDARLRSIIEYMLSKIEPYVPSE